MSGNTGYNYYYNKNEHKYPMSNSNWGNWSHPPPQPSSQRQGQISQQQRPPPMIPRQPPLPPPQTQRQPPPPPPPPPPPTSSSQQRQPMPPPPPLPSPQQRPLTSQHRSPQQIPQRPSPSQQRSPLPQHPSTSQQQQHLSSTLYNRNNPQYNGIQYNQNAPRNNNQGFYNGIPNRNYQGRRYPPNNSGYGSNSQNWQNNQLSRTGPYNNNNLNSNKRPRTDDIIEINDSKTKSTRKKKKPLSQNIPSKKDWTLEEASRALTIEKDYNKRFKNHSLIIKFPDLELNREMVAKFHSAIENVHFQQPSTPRFCFVTLQETANADDVIKHLNTVKFGNGFLTAEYKRDREEDQNIGPEDIDPLTLYVGNLAQEITKEDMVRTYPKGRRIDIGFAKKMKYTRYAFVSFKCVDDSIEAFKSTHNTQMYSKSLIVRFRRLHGTVGMPGESKIQSPIKKNESLTTLTKKTDDDDDNKSQEDDINEINNINIKQEITSDDEDLCGADFVPEIVVKKEDDDYDYHEMLPPIMESLDSHVPGNETTENGFVNDKSLNNGETKVKIENSDDPGTSNDVRVKEELDDGEDDADIWDEQDDVDKLIDSTEEHFHRLDALRKNQNIPI